jgi:hypothetical protein
MNLISEHNFSVAPGEVITIRVMPGALQTNLVAVTLDGQPLQPSGGHLPAEYSFIASQQDGMNHVCGLQAGFNGGAGGAAAYEVMVEGSFGGGEQFSMREDDSTNTVELRFYVAGVDDDAPPSMEDDPPIILQEGGIHPPEPWD